MAHLSWRDWQKEREAEMKELENEAHRFQLMCEAEDETYRLDQVIKRTDWVKNVQDKKIEKADKKKKLKTKDRKKSEMSGKGAKKRKDKREGKKDILRSAMQ
jgi:hypothetical protein